MSSTNERVSVFPLTFKDEQPDYPPKVTYGPALTYTDYWLIRNDANPRTTFVYMQKSAELRAPVIERVPRRFRSRRTAHAWAKRLMRSGKVFIDCYVHVHRPAEHLAITLSVSNGNKTIIKGENLQ